jgi:hypothetical protein
MKMLSNKELKQVMSDTIQTLMEMKTRQKECRKTLEQLKRKKLRK